MPLASDEHMEPSGLRRDVIRGLAWKSVSQLVTQGSRVAVGLVIARLLTPDEYGLAAMAIAFSALALVIADPALGAALIQRATLTEADRSTVFWFTVAAGLACTVAALLLARPVADFFGNEDVAPLFAVESITFLLVALSATQTALLTREMAFRSLELRDMAGTVTGAVAAIALAFAGAGAWAIIAQSVVSASVATALIWRFSTWRPSLTFSLDSLRSSGSFGGKLFVARLASYLNLNADNLLIGRYLGAGPLGVYALAYNVMITPLARVAAPVHGVLFPALARLQGDPDRLGRAWLRGTRLTAAVTVPGFLGMLAVAPDFVPVVLGTRWNDAVPVLQLLCLAGIVQALQSTLASILQATNRAGTYLRFMLFSSTLNVTAFAVGLEWGLVGVAASFAVAKALQLPVFPLLGCRSVELPVREYARALRGVLEAAVGMLAVVVAARELLIWAGAGAAPRLVLLIVLGGASYVALVLWRAPALTQEFRQLRASARGEDGTT